MSQQAQNFKGKLNIYTCKSCRGHIVTKDRDEGVTPFMIKCRASYGCEGSMTSSMYRVFDQEMGHSHEWYRPSAAEVLTLHERDHVEKGGLLLRVASKPAE